MTDRCSVNCRSGYWKHRSWDVGGRHRRDAGSAIGVDHGRPRSGASRPRDRNAAGTRARDGRGAGRVRRGWVHHAAADPAARPQADCAAAADPDRLCVVVLGDSIADGTPLTGDDRWWVRLESLLGTELPDRTVVVAAGRSLGSRIDVLEAAARDQAALDSYDVAIVIEGVNDVGVMPLDDWRSRYEAVIERLEQRCLDVILGTPPPSIEGGVFGARYEPLIEAIRAVADPGRPCSTSRHGGTPTVTSRREATTRISSTKAQPAKP